MDTVTDSTTRDEVSVRLAALTDYLSQDPDNAALRLDTAEAALDAGEFAQAAALVEHPALLAAGDLRARNIAGLAALKLDRFEDAAAAFSAVLQAGQASSEVRFNLAWSRAFLKDFEGVLELLDAETTANLPQAAVLEVQVLHQEGRLDEALEAARRHLELHRNHSGLNAAASVLAIDMEETELAATCAARAGDHPDALTSLATLELGDDNAAGAQVLFERALGANEQNPRAWVGRGLARLMTGETDAAPADLDRGAELFGTHLGSWIAAGWSHFVVGDHATARTRFEKALALDPTFAESHGGLAVLDIAEGRLKEGSERAKVAFRLDRECFGAALARALLAAAEGNSARVSAIVDKALITPVDASGRTIAQSLARMGLG